MGLSQMALWPPSGIKDEVHAFQAAPRKRWFLSIYRLIVLAREGCLCAGGCWGVSRVARASRQMTAGSGGERGRLKSRSF